MDPVILLSLGAGVIILLVILTVFKRKYKQESVQDEQPQRVAPVGPGARRRALAANRNVRNRQREVEEDSDEAQEERPATEFPDGKIGAKKMAKLQAKAEKRAMREAEERNREEKRKAQEKADEERKIKEEKEMEEERKREEKAKKEREEKERKEYEEYLKLKQEFSVQEEGFDEEEESENMLQDFVNYIKDNKVVVLEDIAAQFRLKTQQAIERIQQLQADGTLTGVIDERGKFIYISEEELEAVAKFVKQRGRVSIAELVENSNRLINLTPKVEVTS